jgi:hypothetical protein
VRTLIVLWLLSASLLLPCGPSWAADAGPLVIAVPQGFDGPVRSDESGGVTVGWVKRQPASDIGALLQVSAIDVGTSLDGFTPAQRAEGARHYLIEFIRGIARQRGDFELGDVEQVRLAGLPAARVRWTGTVGGHPAIGVMYCVLVGHMVVSLHTQDAGSEITPAMYSAIGAIEGVRVR